MDTTTNKSAHDLATDLVSGLRQLYPAWIQPETEACLFQTLTSIPEASLPHFLSYASACLRKMPRHAPVKKAAEEQIFRHCLTHIGTRYAEKSWPIGVLRGTQAHGALPSPSPPPPSLRPRLHDSRPLCRGRVYILQADGSPFIKIGRTTGSVQGRITSLRTGCPYPLSMLREIVSQHCDTLEHDLHTRYATYRQHNEWFALPSEVLYALLQEHFA